MIWIFVAALLFGGVFIALGLLGHDHGDAGGIGDAFGGDAHGGDSHGGDVGLLAVFSLRNLAWASFAFGGIGLLAVLTRRGPVTALASSAAAAIVTLLLVQVVFGLLRRTEPEMPTFDALAIGSTARLVLPFDAHDGLGVITLVSNGQVVEMPAKRAPACDGLDSALFATCRIDAITDGIAIVQPGP